jgi:hypothetical protein
MGNGNMNKFVLCTSKFCAFAVLLLLVLISFSANCTKKEQVGRIVPGKGADTQNQEQAPEQLASNMLALQDRISQAPADVSLRRELLAVSVDTSRKIVRAAGRGKTPENAPNSAIAQQSADRASYLDACRWLAYLMQWQQHPESPDFGSINGEIPGARTVSKFVSSGNEVITLVETNLP